jgi:ABC-type branched-subunit amino acid transport system permease subunit
LHRFADEEETVKAFIKWTAITAAAITGAGFAYAIAVTALRRVDDALARADQVAEDAKRALASTEEALSQTQQAVRHLRPTAS